MLMVLAILAIAGFQAYWISKTYDREERILERSTNGLFRETVLGLQTAKLKLDRLAATGGDSVRSLQQFKAFYQRRHGNDDGRHRFNPREKMIGMLDAVLRKAADSGREGTQIYVRKYSDSLQAVSTPMSPRQNRIMQFLYDVDSLQDSIRIKDIDTAFAKRLAEQKIDVPFYVSRVQTQDSSDRLVFNEVTLGFAHPITYRLDLDNTFPYLLKRIAPAILFSVFLVGLTLLSFLLLYRNLRRQEKLADIKNEFISNITHELKTPIATVSVALEALRNFGASVNPQKTKEYLDISANELQRLSLLVDKVLKLSMFDNKEVELKHEPVNLRALADEVAASMRLQFEKRKAVVSIHSDADATLEGDKLHLQSVLFNLMDNALKYSNGHPKIDVDIRSLDGSLQLSVADNGVGIPQEYQGRIFEKFFRVPHGDVHNAKGYGLGLSYVAHVVEQHKGSINVESAEGRGSRFVIVLPKEA